MKTLGVLLILNLLIYAVTLLIKRQIDAGRIANQKLLAIGLIVVTVLVFVVSLIILAVGIN